MSAREVTLAGGSPWGFRMHGGHDLHQPLRISRVNPGSKAAQQGVREGDLISSINGKPTRNLTNTESHDLLRSSGEQLTLGLNQEGIGSPKRRVYKSSLQENTSTETLKRITTKTISSNSRLVTPEHKTNGSDDTKNDKSYVNQNGGLNTSTDQSNGDVKSGEEYEALDYATDAEDALATMPNNSRARKNRRNRNRKRFQPPKTEECSSSNEASAEVAPPNELNEKCIGSVDEERDKVDLEENKNEASVATSSELNGDGPEATSENVDSEKDDVVYENINFTKRKLRNRCRIEKRALDTGTRICEITTIQNLPCEAKVDHIPGVGILETGLSKGTEPLVTVVEPIEPLSKTVTSKVKTLGEQNFALALLAKNNSLDIHEVSDSDVEPDNSRVIVVEVESDAEKEPVGEVVVIEKNTVTRSEDLEEDATLEEYYDNLRTKEEEAKNSENDDPEGEDESLTAEEEELLKPEPPMSKDVEEKLRCFIEGLKLPASPEEARDDCKKVEDERAKLESKAAKKAKKRAILESYFSQTQAANRFLGIIQEEGEKLSEDDEQHIRDFINEEISKYRREERKLRETAAQEGANELEESLISVKIDGPEVVFLKENSDSPGSKDSESLRDGNVYEKIEFHRATPSTNEIIKVTASVKNLPVVEDLNNQNSPTKQSAIINDHLNGWDSETKQPPHPPKRSSSFNNETEPQRPPTPPEIDYPDDLPAVPPLPIGVSSAPVVPPLPPIRRKSVHFAEEDEMIVIPERPPPVVEQDCHTEGCIADTIYENINLTRSTCKLPATSVESNSLLNCHKVRVCQSNVRTEQNTVDFIKTLLTVLTQRNTTYQDVQGFLSGFDLGVLPKNIRDIIDELMEPSSRASSESDSAEIRANSEFDSENFGGPSGDAIVGAAHEPGDASPWELANSSNSSSEVPRGGATSRDREIGVNFTRVSPSSQSLAVGTEETPLVEADRKKERITTEIDAFTAGDNGADGSRLCVKNNQTKLAPDERENSDKQDLEEALCTTSALSPTEYLAQDSSSSTASLSTAKYNPERSSLTDIQSILHDEEAPTTNSPQPKRKLNIFKEYQDPKEYVKDDQDSPQPIPYSPVEEFYYSNSEKSEEFDELVDAKPDLLKDLCIKKILSLPYGEQIISEITLPKFNIFKNLQTIQDSVNEVSVAKPASEGRAKSFKDKESNSRNSDADTSAPKSDPRKLTFEEMSKPRPRTWMGVPTREDPQLFVCLSPSQQTTRGHASADTLLDLHKKFVERRSYHEEENRDVKTVQKYRVEVRPENEAVGSTPVLVGVDDVRNGGFSERWSGDWHIPMPGNRLLEIIKENSVAGPAGPSAALRKEGIVPRTKDAIYNYYGAKCTSSSSNLNKAVPKAPCAMTRVPSLDESQERLRATRLSDWLNLARRNSVDDTNNAPKMSGNLLIDDSTRRKYETTDKFGASNAPSVNKIPVSRAPHPSGANPNSVNVKINREERVERTSKETSLKTSEPSTTVTKKFAEPVHYLNSALIDGSPDQPETPVRSATPFGKNPICGNSAIIDKSSTTVEFDRRTPIPKKNDVKQNVNSALINYKPEVPPKVKRTVNVDRSCIDTTSIFDKTPPRNHLQKRRHHEADEVKHFTAVEIMENLKQLQSDMKRQMDDRRRFSLPQEYFDKQLNYIEQLEDQLKNVLIAEEEEQKAFEDVLQHVEKLKPRPHSVIGGPSVNFNNFKPTTSPRGSSSRDAWTSKDREEDENGFNRKDAWHEESENVMQDKSEYVKKDGYHEESKRTSNENGYRTEESKSSESKEERYVVSKRGDLVERVQPRLNVGKSERPRSACIAAIATSGEKFREQMYNEYVNKVQEREERKHHKVIKISSHKELANRKNDPPGQVRGGSIEKEFIARAKNRLDKFGIKLDESESEVEGRSDERVRNCEPNRYVIDGDEVIDVRTLPKHLQEFLRLGSQDEDARGKDKATDLLHEIDKALKFGKGFLLGEENNMFAPSFKATSTKPGVWSPGSEPPPPPKQPSPDRGKETDASDKDAGIPPVWTPTSANASPVAERKEFRPVPFESPVLSRKNKLQPQSSTEEAPPPWEGEIHKREASQVLSQTITTRIVNSHSAPSQGLNTLASLPRLPRAQNPTITLLQKAREGQLPKGAAYLEEVNHHGVVPSKDEEKPIISPGEIIYTVKKEYESEPESEKDRPKKMADLGPRKFEGIGPMTKEGIPLVLRSEVKENNQAKWYKKMYDSLHRAENDEDYITIRYKPRRGTRYGYGSASGYLSEPEPRGNADRSATLDSRRRQRNKENDFTTSTVPRKNGQAAKQTADIYRNQPGRIEDYEPGRSSIADKETKEWWDEVMDIFDGWLDENVSPQEHGTAELTTSHQRRLSESSRQPLSLSYMGKRSDVNDQSVRELSASSSGSKYPDITSKPRRRSPEKISGSFARADSQPIIFRDMEVKTKGVEFNKTRSPRENPTKNTSGEMYSGQSVPLAKSRSRSVLDLNRVKFHSLRSERSLNKIGPGPMSYSTLSDFERSREDGNDVTVRRQDTLNIFRKTISLPEGKSKSFILPDRCTREINQHSMQQPTALVRAKRPTRLNRTMDQSDRVFLPQYQQMTSLNNHRLQQCLSPCRSTSGTNHNIQPPQPSAKTSALLRPFEQHTTHTAKPYMSHALKESGYESDSTLVFRRREDASPLSPLEQRLAYKTVQRGGDVPLHGLRKPAPERPKDDDSVIEYFPLSPTLTRIRVHKKIPPSTTKDSLTRSRTTVSTPPTPPSMIFSQYKRSAPSLAISPTRSSHHVITGRSHSTPSRVPSPPPGRPPSRVASPSGRPPSPPRRRSSRNNTTLRLYSKMQVAENPHSTNPRHEQCFSADNVSNIRFLRDRLSCNLEKHRRDKEEAQRVRVTRTLSSSPVTTRTKVYSTVTADFSGQRSEPFITRSSTGPERSRTRTVSSPSPVSRRSTDPEQKLSGTKRPLDDKPPIKRVPSKSPMSTCSSRESTVDRLYSPERTCYHGSRSRIADTSTKKDQARPKRTKKEQDEVCKRLSRSPDLASPQEVRRAVQRQREKDVQTKLLPSGTVVKSSTTLYSSVRNAKQNPQEDKSLKVTVAISSKGRELLRKTTEASTSSRSQALKSGLTSSPVISRKTTFAEPVESPRPKISKQRENLQLFESKESLKSVSTFDNEGVAGECNKRKRPRDKPQTIVKSPIKKPETICVNPDGKERREEKRKSRKERNSETSKGKKSSNGKKNEAEKKRSRKGLGKAAGTEIAKELKKLDPRDTNVQRLTVDQIRRHQEIMKSDTFFQNLFLRNVSSPTPSQSSALRMSSVLERARIFQAENSENFKSEPSLRSLNIYLTSKKPVSNSKFKNWERESISSRCSSPYGVSWPGRSVFQKISKFDSLLSIDDYAMEFGSVSSFRGRSPDLTRDCHKERSLSEPPLKVLPEKEEKIDFEEAPPRPASPSPVRSPACRRIQSLRHQDTPGMTIMRKARARSAEEVDQRKKSVSGSTLSLCKSTSSLNLSQVDRDEYQQYVLEMLHCKRKSRRYRDLHDFYASLERMGELERTTSSGDLRPRLRNEEIIDYDRWKEVRSKERAERELEVLYGKLRNVQKEKDFLFRPKEVDQFRWKGDSGLRCKEKSVENIREKFQKLESQESELESSRRRDMAARKDVYKPLWRGNSVVSVAHTLDKRAALSENFERGVKPELPKNLGVSRKLWSSLSIEQVNALKNQLNEIYSNDNGKPEIEKPKVTSKSDYEIVVPPQEEFGEDLQEENKTLHVRCHSMVTPDICKIAEKADSKLEEERLKSPLKRSGSISRGRSVERSQSERSSGMPPMSELEKKRLSLTLSKEILDKVTQKKALQTSIPPRETRGAIAAASAQPKPSSSSATPSFSSASPRTCYSLEMSEEGANKPKDKSDFLLVLTPTDETPKNKRRVENVLEQWSKKQPAIAMVVTDETAKPSRPASTSEVDSTTESSEASVRTVIRQGSAEDVPRKVEFFEKFDGNTTEMKSSGSFSHAASTPEGLERLDARSTFSQSFADLKELFGESESAKFATLSSYGSRPRSTSPRRSLIALPDVPQTRSGRSRLVDEDRERPRSASPYRPISNTSSADSLWKRSDSPDPERYWRAYLKLVRSGAVKRLRAKYESLEELPGGRIKVVPTPKRFQSDPELTRNLLKNEIDKVIVKGQEIADVNWLRRKYEAVPGRARRRGTSPPIPRVPLRMEDLGMPRIHVISKLAELKEQRTSSGSTTRRMEANELEAKRAVGRIRKKFEKDHNVSILGEMFTSAPNVHELRDIAPYLAGQWVAHRFPSRRDNARCISSPELEKSSPSRQVSDREASERTNFGRPRATSSSPVRPRRPPSILKQSSAMYNSGLTKDPFANQQFDPSKHRPRYRYQPTPPKVIHRESTPWWPPIPTYTARPTVTFEEYATAPPPPPKAPHYKGDRQESPRRYVEGEVTIHYRSPVRTEAKEVLSEAELARRSAENMRRVYQEERRRKYLQELHDIDSRRHTDNFTPSQKSPIPLNRYDDFVDDLSHRSRSQEQTPEPRLVAKALYNFVGQSSRELTFRRGDIIFVRRQVDKNWYEGEHNAMIGLFPFNYVEILPYDGIRTTTTPKKPYEGQARAKFNFVAQTTHELSLVKGDLVVLTRRVDENWYEGRIGNRKGIFPISYVEVLVEPGIRPETPAQNKPVAAPAAHSLLSNGSAGGKLSMGPHHYTPSIPTNTNAAQPHYNSLPRMGGSKLHVAPVNETLHIDTHSEPLRYRALYNYRPQNDDELELKEGDAVYVMEKCDDGWFVGSSQRTGCFGTFPGNYVERL